jgi:ribosomal protein S13
MSEFAFFRFLSTNMLTSEEEKHKQEMVELTEEVLDAKGIECDARISKLSEDKLKEILHEVRKLRKKRKRASGDAENDTEEEEQVADAEQGRTEDLEEPEYVR